MEENANTTFPVVVLTFEGSEDRMKALWEKNFQGVFKTVSVKPGYSILDVLAGILADNTIEKEFVLVQANTFPVAETTIDFLKLPFVYTCAQTFARPAPCQNSDVCRGSASLTIGSPVMRSSIPSNSLSSSFAFISHDESLFSKYIICARLILTASSTSSRPVGFCCGCCLVFIP